jgi:hypothetical protein
MPRSFRVKHGKLNINTVSRDTKGGGIKTACSCGGAPSNTNLETLREKLSKLTIQKPTERKRYLSFDIKK